MGIESAGKASENYLNNDNNFGEQSKNELVPTQPLFEYNEPDERTLAKKIVSIPEIYENIEDAYTQLADDPQLKKGTVPTSATAENGYYDKEQGKFVRPTNPIAMGYLLHAIGIDNFDTIVSNMVPDERRKVLQAIIAGDTSAIFETFLPSTTTTFDSMMKQSDIFESSHSEIDHSTERQRAEGQPV